MFGGVVGIASKKVFHLRRGNIYNIENKSFFVMGGAKSIDKESRKEGISWWKEEEPSFNEFELALSNLDLVNNQVDYILAHTCPKSVSNIYLDDIRLRSYDDGKGDCQVARFFDEIITKVNFKEFYFGHWHDEWSYDKFHMLYNRIIELKE